MKANPLLRLLQRCLAPAVAAVLLATTPRASAAVNLFLTFFDKADGESIQKGKEKWVELQSASFKIEAETSWTQGGGASVGKPNPGKFFISKYLDTSSSVIHGYIATGKAFPKVQIVARKITGAATPEDYLIITMEGVYVTTVEDNGSEEGTVTESVSFVYKTIKMEYRPQDPKSGTLGPSKIFTWDVPAGTASPSS